MAVPPTVQPAAFPLSAWAELARVRFTLCVDRGVPEHVKLHLHNLHSLRNVVM